VGEGLQVLTSVVSACGIFFAARQLGFSKAQAETAFEDSLAREYRELAQGLPTSALLGESLEAEAQLQSLDEFFHYIDMSNEQVFLRMEGRVRRSTWKNWCAGIQSNLSKPAFRHAWDDVSKRNPDSFSELRRLITSNFAEDPRTWH